MPAPDFAHCLAELDAVSAELAATPPGEFTRMQRLLARRQAALQLLDEGEPAPPQLEQMQRAFDAGQLLAERLRLAQVALRDELREMHRVGVTLRAFGAAAPAECGASLDLQA